MEMMSVFLVIVHCVLLSLTFFDNFGATCALDRKYPICFFVAGYTQLFFYLLTYTYKCCGYWMSESLVSDDQKIVIENLELEKLIETGNSNSAPDSAQPRNKNRMYSDFEILNA